MAEVLLHVFGAANADRSRLEKEVSEIFGSPAETDVTLSGVGSAISLVVGLGKANLAQVAEQLIAFVHRIVGGAMVEVVVDGRTVKVNGATPDQIMQVLRLALASKPHR